MNANSWDADAYDGRFGFVDRYGDDLSTTSSTISTRARARAR